MSVSLRGPAAPGQCCTRGDRRHARQAQASVDLQAKATAAIAEEEDFLHGSMGISFWAIGRVRGIPEWWVAPESRQRHQETETG